MPFRKIRETIQAFSAPANSDNLHAQIAAHRVDLHRQTHPVEEDTRPNVAVAVLAVIGSAAFAIFLEHWTRSISLPMAASTNTVLHVLAVAAGCLVAYLIGRVEGTFHHSIPIHKLNPFFGSKLNETIAAFRQRRA